MKKHIAKCELCPNEFVTIYGRYCPTCRVQVLKTKLKAARAGKKYHRKPSTKPRFFSQTRCPKCQKIHTIEMKSETEKVYPTYCYRCREYVAWLDNSIPECRLVL